MLLKRKGWPEEGELAICTVTKITGNCVFVNLDEYNKSGMIHISEVSPGRIRNLRDFVKEGRVVICKILKIDEQKGHIDLSLRRVSESMRRKKNEEIKQEQKAEKIVEMVAHNLKVDARKLYEAVAPKILEKYDFLYNAFEDVALKGGSLADLGVDKKYAKALDEAVKQKITPPEVSITGTFTLLTYAPDGVRVIKTALKPAEEKEGVSVKYLGKGQYLISVKDEDYKSAEKTLRPLVENAISYVEKHDGMASFERKEE